MRAGEQNFSHLRFMSSVIELDVAGTFVMLLATVAAAALLLFDDCGGGIELMAWHIRIASR